MKFLIYRREEDTSKYLCRKVNWFDLILRRNCFLHDAIEGQMTEVKVVGRRRTTQLLDNWRNRRYWELKEKPED